MVSNGMEVELQRVRNSVNCVQRVNSLFMNTYNVFNSTCTVAGPNTRSKLLTYTEKELKLYSSFSLTVCACAEKGSTLYRKNMRKKIRTVIIYSGKVLKRVVCTRKIAVRLIKPKYLQILVGIFITPGPEIFYFFYFFFIKHKRKKV